MKLMKNRSSLKKLKFISILKDTINDQVGISKSNQQDRMEVFYDFIVSTNQKLGSDGVPSLTTLKIQFNFGGGCCRRIRTN